MQARRVPQFSTPSSDIRSVFQRAEEAHAALEKLEDAILSAEAKRRISAAESGKAELLTHDEFMRKVRLLK